MSTGRSRTARLRHVAVDVRPLRQPDFRRLFIGQGVSFVGYQLTAVAVPVQMYAITGSSLWVGVIGIAAFVPLVVSGLWGGAVSDAVDRGCSYIGVLVPGMGGDRRPAGAGALGRRTARVLLLLVAVQSVGFALSSPVRGAILPRLLPRDQVPAGTP